MDFLRLRGKQTMQGWIKLHRQFTQWEWYTDDKCFRLFIHLLLRCNHEEAKWQGETIQRGEVITSLGHLSNEVGMTMQTLRTTLKKLEKTGEINKQSTSKLTRITICNYDTYQDGQQATNKQTNKPLTNDQQATNKQLTTNKNDNNNKNEENEKNLPPNGSECEDQKPAKIDNGENEEFNEVYNHWNGTIGTITHRAIKPDMRSAYKSLLSDGYNKIEIMQAMAIYGSAVQSDKCWVSHKWNIKEFLTQQNACRKYIDCEGDYNWLMNKERNQSERSRDAF